MSGALPEIVIEQTVSADGFAAEPDGGLRFVEAVVVPDAGGRMDGLAHERTDAHQLAFVERIDAILLGRRTYEMFESFWPTADPDREPIAVPINALPKLVVSETIERAPWGDVSCEVVRGGVEGTLRATSRYRRVVVWGSLTLSRALIAADAVHSIRLRRVPVFIGAGLSFIPSLPEPLVASLGDQHRFPTGHVTTEYLLGGAGASDLDLRSSTS